MDIQNRKEDLMLPRTGRPPIGESSRDKQYRLRMSSAEWKKLEYCCQATGLAKADVLRLGIEKVYQEILTK